MTPPTCDEPRCKAPPIKGFPTCGIHKRDYRGTGQHINCTLCGKPQKRHKAGYWEHATVARQIAGPKTAAAWKLMEKYGH